MKQALIIAAICAVAPLSALAGAETASPSSAAPAWALEANENSSAPEQLWLAKGASQGCVATTAGGGSQKCSTQGSVVNFPVMIGVYR